ncbi:hypothetical protein IPM65_07150 [Candidatus Roizmanbacteria bacterium]|nr:MAG: hypothetical protein IPM65_07150 [Candidatus Roizmanbacteria bacterium]
MKKLLLCPPTFYDIRYEINPWMDRNNAIDKTKAQEEYNTLTYAYDQLGIQYEELGCVEELPDQVFTTDLGHAENNIFIKANFKYSERQKEADIAEEYFKQRGFEIKTLPDDVYFEGGDFLKMGEIYLFGYGKRSSKDATAHLSDILGKEILSLELPDEYFYHLDTCVAPLNEDTVLVHEKALTDEGLALIKKQFKTVIPTSETDNNNFACNLVTFENDLIMTQGISNELKDILTHMGFRIITIPMSQYLKGGGSVHCVSMEIFE